MIYTITLNPALDKTVVIPSFQAGHVNRVQSIRHDPGGKGINVSKNLQTLGCRSLAIVALAGQTGRQIDEMLREQRVETLVIPADAPTRTNLKISDPIGQSTTDINEPGPMISHQVIDQLSRTLRQRLKSGDSLVLAGSVPPGMEYIYCDLGKIGQAAGARVFLDTAGPALARGIEARPFLIKPNREELSELAGCALRDEAMICGEALRLINSGIRHVVVSLGREGLIMVNADQILIAAGLDLEAVSTVGAGDAVMAVLVDGFSRQDVNLPDLIRLAAGAGSASVMSPGSQPPRHELIQQMAAQIKVTTRPINTKVRYNDNSPIR